MKGVAWVRHIANLFRLTCTLSLGIYALAGNQAWAASCRLIRISNMHVSDSPRGPVTTGTLDGHKIKVLIDTGSSKSMIVYAAAVDAGLHPVQMSNTHVIEVYGDMTAESVYVKRLRFGHFVIKHTKMMVTTSHLGDIGLVLGAYALSRVDVEIDLAHHKLIFWQPHHCAHTPLAYWTKHYLSVPLTRSGDYAGPGSMLGINVKVDGKPVHALLDSGTDETTMTLSTARSLGFDVDTAREYSVIRLLSGKQLPVYKAVFNTFTMGPITVKHPRFLVSDLRKGSEYMSTGSRIRRRRNEIPDMLIGTDFLRADHVYIANSQHMLYFTYNGGQMFQQGP